MNALVHILEFPSSALLAVSFLLVAFAMHHYWGESRGVKLLTQARTALVLLAMGALMLAIEGTWALPIHTSVVFALYAFLLILSLALTIFKDIKRRAKGGFLLNHIGIFLIIWASYFGAPDVSKSKMILCKGESSHISYTRDGMAIPLPFDIELQDFQIEFYADNLSPRQFTSSLIVGGEAMQTEVNSPCHYDGYTIYQDSYDRQRGQYTVLQIVRNPWLPIVYIGFAVLAIGSVILLFGKWKLKAIIPVTLILTVLFTIFTVAKINFGTLMPALRSWWFVPHLFIYMVAYSLMAMALISRLVPRLCGTEVSERLFRSSTALLIIGMLTGSVWARQAWGDYWAWDPKENWAAVTWFVALMYMHLGKRRGGQALTIIILAFIALQITWYGVNYLPSAVHSLHTYNSKS